MTGKYFDVPASEGGFEHYEYGTVPVSSSSMNGKATGSMGHMNLTTRRRFFRSAAVSRWDEEVNVVDEKVERVRDALRYYQLRLHDLVEIVDRAMIGEDEEDEEDEEEVAMSVDL